ncbi:mediator of RNA polymerase II transcription subunit 13-like isoform X2 [Aphis craccivora]|uniref:Mediator of RNA polymerase II transcription subunit 13-like isoform X2 n=1 Tax=Aphis craccivora TaxID=307492 RepID=A0A6G0Z5Q1_APHCR|nr:mediator of RNA polymerase II transcription subunit 13-like isoform X2 [Aphis craccivora]
MTHSSHQTNGASLEDCHTNFFALFYGHYIFLASLCGVLESLIFCLAIRLVYKKALIPLVHYFRMIVRSYVLRSSMIISTYLILII